MNWFTKWFIRYWRWTWPLLAICGYVGWKLFGGGDPTPMENPATEIAEVVSEGVSSTSFWILFLAEGVALFLWAIARGRPPAWMFAVTLGVTTFHWLFWSISPDVWNTWFRSATFWPMNFAIILATFFASQPNRPVRYAGYALMVLVVLALIPIGMVTNRWYHLKNPITRVITTYQPSPVMAGGRLPWDDVWPVLSGCESGNRRPGSGRHFEDDEVTPRRNREGSSAFGLLQYLEFHRTLAAAQGFDLNTEAGQIGYGRNLYAERGTLDWEEDIRSRNCWEPILLSMGHAPTSVYGSVTVLRMLAPHGELSDMVRLPGGRKVILTPEEAVTYTLVCANGEEVTAPGETQARIKAPCSLTPWFQLRGDGGDVFINIVTYEPRVQA